MRPEELTATLRRAQPHILAIDGNCCSGKTTLAARLSADLGAQVFHMDDFYLRPEQRSPARLALPGGNIDHERFLEEVLAPLCAGETRILLRRFDCKTLSLLPPDEVLCPGCVIVEGSYAMHPVLRARYDYSIVLRVEPAVQRARLIAREGAARAEHFFSPWLPLEARYFSALDPAFHADAVIDTSNWTL